MPRTPRIKIGDQDTFYHITARVIGTPDWFPFADSAARNKLLSLIRKYTRAYFCRVASFSLMSNHYHLLVRFQAARKLSRKELRERATLLYPDPGKVLKTDHQWERFNRRLFDLSEMMRNIQGAYTKWYNRKNGRRGSLWDGRFGSTIPLDQEAVQETLAYIELNPVRAGLVSRPEDYVSSSAFLRHIGADDWLMSIDELFEGADQMQSYRGFLYYRGFEGGSKEGARIPARILQQEQQRGFNRQGIYRKRLRYFAEGLVLGSEEKIRDWISDFRRRGRYLRRSNPIPHLDGLAFTLREQRASAKTTPG